MNGWPSVPNRDAEALTGHLAEYGELAELEAERPGLLVVAGDPLSGTSALLTTMAESLEGACIYCDARTCLDVVDLAMAIADRAVSVLAPEAEAWWMGEAAPGSTAGLRLSRELSPAVMELDDLRHGSGRGLRLLSDAIELVITLESRATLVLDHLGLMLSAMQEPEARALLGELRAARQRHPRLDLVLVEHSGGMMSQAFFDTDHPMFQSGQVVPVRRPTPARFAGDLAVARAWTDVSVENLEAAAELTAGVPALTWRTLELTRPGEAPVVGWRRLRKASEVSTAQQWDLLRRVHRQAQPVVAAMSTGLRPHAVAANAKSVNDALIRLRGLGYVWQPEERKWSLANPLLKAWVRDHAPSWARRRSKRDQG